MTMTRRDFGKAALGWLAVSRAPFDVRAQTPPIPFISVDTHSHVFERRLKLARVRRYAPNYDATPADYLRQLDAHEISHGVLIQPSFLGTDNGFLQSVLKSLPSRVRGIAVVDPDESSGALAALDAAGFVGIRLNLVGEEIPALASPPWADLLRRVAALDWQVEVHREARDLPLIVDPLLRAGVKVVVDHFGRPDPKLGIDDPGFRYLLSVAATGRVWVKLSGAYRNGGPARGEAIAKAAVPLLRRAFGLKRLLWGSDWPHTQFERVTDYDAAMAAFLRWIPDPADRAVILCETPRALFRFP
jgi:predicted TIM-barrel fold metal-dependent hydrolase